MMSPAYEYVLLVLMNIFCENVVFWGFVVSLKSAVKPFLATLSLHTHNHGQFIHHQGLNRTTYHQGQCKYHTGLNIHHQGQYTCAYNKGQSTYWVCKPISRVSIRITRISAWSFYQGNPSDGHTDPGDMKTLVIDI